MNGRVSLFLLPTLLAVGLAIPAGAERRSGASPLGRDYETAANGEASRSYPEPRGVIGLEEARGAALGRHPALVAGGLQLQVREAEAVQAGLLPNPTLGVEVENILGSGDRENFEQAETTIGVSQTFPVGGKLGLRQSLARLDADLASWGYESARLDVLTETTKTFVSLLAAQRRLKFLSAFEEIVRSGVESLAAQVRAGAASSVDHTRAEVLRVSVALERGQALRAVQAHRVALAAAWGSVTPLFDRVRGDLREGVAEPPSLDELQARADFNPDLARWKTEVAARETNLSFADAEWLPDPTIQLSGRHFNANDDGALVVALSLPLPVFDRNQGRSVAAARELDRVRARRVAVETALRAAIAQRYHQLQNAYEQSTLLRTEALPLARRAFEGARDGYRRGTFRFLDLLDAQRTLLDIRIQELEMLTSYHQLRADLERLIGASIDGEPVR